MEAGMYPFTISHHGAVNGVTGSCHELRLGDFGVLVDCGLFQGAETSGQGAGAEQLQIEFPITNIKALVATHVHIDHVGRIPYLLAAGFKGPILCSEPSAELLPLVLEDAVKIGFTRDAALVKRFMAELKQRIIALHYKRWFTLLDKDGQRLRVRLQRAGHILGSAYVEFEVSGIRESKILTRISDPLIPHSRRVVFSGDLGAPHAPLLPAPKPPYRCDTLVLESTYGDRNHPDRRHRRAALQGVLEHALSNSGVVLVPAFSIGRTQELLYELEGIIAQGGKDWAKTPIIVDSPLASRFTETYRKLKPFWDEEAHTILKQGRDPLNFEQLVTINTHSEHERMLRHLQETQRPAIVIAASGMCAGGRIVNYLKAFIGEPRSDVLFVGYQARGTPGREILKNGAKRTKGSEISTKISDPLKPNVVLDGQRYPIRAAVHQISGYSAHADRQNLVDFARRMRHPPSEIRLIHGEEKAKEALAQELRKVLPDAKVWIP